MAMSANVPVSGSSCTVVSAMNTVRPLASIMVEAEQARAGPRIDHPEHVLETRMVGAGKTRDHGIGVPMRDHARRKYVAALVHQPLAVAEQETLPLLAPVEELGVMRVCSDSRALWISTPSR